MSEELLKAIVQLFAIVAKERITEDERTNIKEFLSVHLNQEAMRYYLQLFDSFIQEKKLAEFDEVDEADEETREFLGDWSTIMQITRQINQGLTRQQKLVLIEKIIELILADNVISERQSNLIYYIGEVIKVDQLVIHDLIEFIKMKEPDDFNSEDLLVINNVQKKHKYKSKHLALSNLSGMISILRIKDAEVYFIKYVGDDLLTLNGVPLRDRSIAIFPTGSTIRGEKIKSLYYSDVVNTFLQSEVKTRLSFKAENIVFRFKSGDLGIRNVNIAEEGGKLFGIMGASGSGKTTLLNILNGSEPPTEGRVTINGIDVHWQHEEIQGVIGYVPQDDFLIEELTVYQNLYFAAKLCFSNYDEEKIDELVCKTLRNLGLLEIKDLRVGAPLDKIISGGQRKRLNIGLELLRKPTVLFVDEPTSGLSSRDSENIMDLLKELSLKGQMVFVVIHQPSSDIFKMFDILLILDIGGYPIYYGNPEEAVVYFKNIVNMVNREQGACPECGNVNPEQIFNIIETKVVNEYGRFTNQRKISPRQWNEIFKERVQLPQVETIRQKLNITLNIPSWFNQLKVFYLRDFLAKLNNVQYVVVNVFEAPALALFLASLVRYYHINEGPYTYYDNVNIPIYFFMSVVVALFMGMTVSAEEIIKDRKILKRESFLNLSRSSYLSSKILILFVISAIQTFLFVLIGSFILEIHGLHLAYWLILFSTACSANMIGLNVSAAFKSAVTVYILIPLLLIPQIILSGVVISFDKFNPKMTNLEKVPVIGDLMTSRWAFEATMVHFFTHNRYERHFYELGKIESEARYVKTYLMEELKTRLSNLMNHRLQGELNHETAGNNINILRTHIRPMLDEFGHERLPEFDQLTLNDFNRAVHDSTMQFLDVTELVYVNRMKETIAKKDSIVKAMMGKGIYKDYRESYHNNDLEKKVKNEFSVNKILEYKGKLVRKFEPIFMDPGPDSVFDYRATFYTPRKNMAGVIVDTIYFNLLIIWIMSFILYFTLYYDIFGKVIRFLSRFGKLANVMPRERRYE